MVGRKRSSSKGYVIGTVIGSFIGAAGALMLAPEKGTTVRKQLFERLNQAAPTKSTVSQTLLELGQEWSKDVEEIVKESKSEKQDKEQENQQPQLGNLIETALEQQDDSTK